MSETTRSHPSYGVIRICRTSGGNRSLYGSPVENTYYLSIEIDEAVTSYNSDLGTQHIRGSERIIEIQMSYDQFAQFITGVGLHAGVPCTISYRCDKDPQIIRPDPETKSEAQNLINSVREIVKQFSTDRTDGPLDEELEGLLSKKNLTKQDRDRIKGIYNQRNRIIADTIPWYMTRMQEVLSSLVHVAKSEIHTFQTLTSPGSEIAIIGLPSVSIKGDNL